MPKKIICTLDQYANIFRHCELTYKQFKKLIHKKNKRSLNQQVFSFRCKVCMNHRDTSPHRRCNGCQDLFHLKCVDEESKQLCSKCQVQLQNMLLKLQYITQVEGDTLIVHECKSSNSICSVCYIICDENQNQSKICYRCNLRQHVQCYNSQNEFCSVCDQYLKDNLPYQFDTIPNYIQLWKSEYTCQDDLIMIDKIKKQNRVRLYLPKYSDSKEQQFQESYSLIKALCAKSIYFSDDLTYFPEDSKPEDNNAKYERKLEDLDEDNLKSFLQFKEYSRLGITPQLMVDFHIKTGFIAKSTGFIKKGSILAEYCGEVKKWKNIIFDQNDSIMELLSHPNPKKTLYVVPEKYSNIARFVCGIDNKIKEQVEIINVKCLRVAINKQARIIMYACKDIQPNEILYYDYNSGGKYLYPTEGYQIL
ncbi:unnamed protein product [Paramecium primaurelia]|uniref:SET domain-containing protein n=1 Tax=Paramecium primaurelia TaxID=5886 RepID=A0A8S1Q9Z2_PARPR|nr:unnamed protein product [Paramecium primaurelia]